MRVAICRRPAAPRSAEFLREHAEDRVLSQRRPFAREECVEVRIAVKPLVECRERLHLQREDAVAIDQRRFVECASSRSQLRELGQRARSGHGLACQVQRVEIAASSGCTGWAVAATRETRHAAG